MLAVSVFVFLLKMSPLGSERLRNLLQALWVGSCLVETGLSLIYPKEHPLLLPNLLVPSGTERFSSKTAGKDTWHIYLTLMMGCAQAGLSYEEILVEIELLGSLP